MFTLLNQIIIGRSNRYGFKLDGALVYTRFRSFFRHRYVKVGCFNKSAGCVIIGGLSIVRLGRVREAQWG
ncbi:MAG: hypothetical protein LZF61_09235 [Nitrosomonas sp.]|nr:MAG: hypothetical protein LZF61_09235 [Nitrosomonas sp.]